MKKDLRIVFWGCPQISADILEHISNTYNIVSAVTQCDKPSGRKREICPTPVKEIALSKNIPVLSDENENELINGLNRLKVDIFIVIAYGKKIPQEILNIPRICLNIHYSILPEFRGPSPISYALLCNKRTTGISIIDMNEEIDAGDVLYSKSIDILPEDDYFSLEKRLTDLAKVSIMTVLSDIDGYMENAKKQDRRYVSYTHIIRPNEANINWYDHATKVSGMIKAFVDWPQAYTYLRGRVLKILSAKVSDENSQDNVPGTVINIEKRSFSVQCSTGVLQIIKVKPSGSSEMDSASFINGRKIAKFDVLMMDFSYDWNADGIDLQHLSNYDLITLHHTNSFNYSKKSDEEIFNEIRRYHIEHRKWKEIGYHFLIGRKGEIFVGRYPNPVGAHTKGRNEKNLGIALIGDYNLTVPPIEQINGLLKLVKKIKSIRDIPVFYHKHFKKEVPSNCPGDLLCGMRLF